MRILIVGDEPSIQEIVQSMLESAGHQIELSADGNAAFQKFCERGPFDLVLTDIEHPGPNGIELAKMINDRSPEQRIGFLTTYRVLSKPFDREALLKFIESFEVS
jgi:CheY-like chemotaxis protein